MSAPPRTGVHARELPVCCLVSAPPRASRTRGRALASWQPILLFAAFWLALLGFRSGGLRHLIGLALGAGLAQVGCPLLHLDAFVRVGAVPAWPDLGLSLLFVPLGPLLVAPRREGSRARDAWLAAALRSLVPALAVARIGCLAAGCCGGTAIGLPVALFDTTSGRPLVHPVAAYEIVAWLVLASMLRRASGARAVALFFFGFGVVRLVLSPLRAEPAAGPTRGPVALVAAAWITAGLVREGIRRHRVRPCSR